MVVVGAGLGGLAAAARLAHAGEEVVVVDRLARPGGKLRALHSDAGPIDAGPTVLTLRDVFDALFDDVDESLSSHLELVEEPLLARHWWPDGSGLDLHADSRANTEAVGVFSGSASAEEFRAFDDWAERLFTAFEAPMMRSAQPDMRGIIARTIVQPRLGASLEPGRTLASALARRFRDPRLRQLFGRYATYVGGSPDASPALLALVWRAEARGVWRVEGGMHRLATAIESVARARGARFVYQAEAQEIEVGSAGVTGVLLTDGERLPARAVVFNGDPAALERGLLGREVRPSVKRGEVSPRSHSAHVWTFASAPSDARLAHHNVFFAKDPHREFRDLARGLMPSDPTVYVCAQDRGTGLEPNPRERFELIANGAPVDAGRPAEGEHDTCRTRTFETLSRMGLTFREMPETDCLTTPADFAALFPGSDGSIYGRSPHGLMAALQRPRARTAIPGLYLAGGGVHPGPGMPMATLSGKHAAEAILKDRVSTFTFRRTATHGGT